MKRIILLAGILFALTLILRDQSQVGSGGEVAELKWPSAIEQLRSPAKSFEEPLATEVLEEEAVGEGAESVPAFFPQSIVISSVRDPERDDGSQRVIENVETTMRDKLVRVERLVQPLADGGSRVVEEVAMVANQLMLQKPVGMASYMFLDLLSQAGAVEVKELDGDAFLATFRAQPDNPRALEAHSAKVQELAGVDITMEPNYIRKIF